MTQADLRRHQQSRCGAGAARSDSGYVATHEVRYCIQDRRLSVALSELDSDRQATRHFPEIGAVNERVRLIGSVLDAAFRHVDGHETGYVQMSPDPALPRLTSTAPSSTGASL